MWNPLDGLATVNVGFKKIHPDAKMPTYGSVEAAGADLYAVKNYTLKPGEWQPIDTGIAIELPKGFEAQVRPRSGLAAKWGLSIANAPGTIDSDYRGEIKVILLNNGTGAYTVEVGDRIAQLVVVPVFRAHFINTEHLNDTTRGAFGFGSTGR